MSRNLSRRGGSRVVVGLVVILIGVLALLDKQNLFELRLLSSLWPLALVVAGVMQLLQRRQDPRSAGSRILSLGLIAVGSLMTLSKLGFMNFQLRDWWPALLIAVGLLVLLRGLRPNARADASAVADTSASGAAVMLGNDAAPRQSRDASLYASGALSGSVIKNDSQAFLGGEVDVFMAGIEIDLRQASIETEAVLHVFAMWGGITIKVPLDWSVQVNTVALMGGVDDKSVPPMGPAKRLRIEGCAIMGGVEIRN